MSFEKKASRISKADAWCISQKGEKVYYFARTKMILLPEVEKKIGTDYMKSLLYLTIFGSNKYNRVDFDTLVKRGVFSENTLKKFRGRLSKNGIVKKIKRNDRYGRYLNPCISEIGTPNNDWLFDYFREDIENIYNLQAE